MTTDAMAAAEMLDVIDKSAEGVMGQHKGLARLIVGLAYMEPFKDADLEKQLAVAQFALKVYIDCLRTKFPELQ